MRANRKGRRSSRPKSSDFNEEPIRSNRPRQPKQAQRISQTRARHIAGGILGLERRREQSTFRFYYQLLVNSTSS